MLAVVPGVFGTIFALAIGLRVSMRDLKKFRGRYRCFAYLDTATTISGVFGGVTTALWYSGAWWPYLVAAILSSIPATVLLARLEWEREERIALGKYYKGFYPDGVLKTDLTFNQVISLALKQYGRISASNVPLLSFPSLKQAYKTVVRNERWLSEKEFKAECVLNLSFNEAKGFRDRASLIIFVVPSDVPKCQEWFVQYAMLLKLFRVSKDNDLADVVRLIWKWNDGFSVADRRDCFLDAFYRLSGEKSIALAMCEKLSEKHSADAWIRDDMPKYKAKCEGAGSFSLRDEGELQLGTWFTPGNKKECQVCGYKPPKEKTSWALTWYERRKRALRARNHCAICNINALRLTTEIAAPPVPESRDSSATPAPEATNPPAADEADGAGPSIAAIADATGNNPEQYIIDVTSPSTTETMQ